MKYIKYRYCTKVEIPSKDGFNTEEVFSDIKMKWTEETEAIAKKEAYNGEYIIEDDGIEEMPTQADRFEAQLTYTAMMTGTLLEEV